MVVGFLPLLLADKLVVKVFEFSQESDNPTLVLFVARLFEPVLLDLKHLELVVKTSEVVNTFVKLVELVLANGEDIKIAEVLEALDLADFIVEKG